MRRLLNLLIIFTSIVISTNSYADLVCKTTENSDDAQLVIKNFGNGTYTAQVSDPAIILDLKRQYYNNYNQTDYSSLENCGVRETSDGRLILSNLVLAGNSFVSAQFCPYITRETYGLRIVMTYFKMTSSHTYEYKTDANWFFNICK